jgi:putative ABC transport system permease protein
LIGGVGAWLLGDTVEAFMFGVSPGDPVTFVAITTLLFFTALGATLIPATAAMRVDPVRVLKAD